MTKKVKIVTDSASDCGNVLYEKYDIAVIPMTVGLGEKNYLDQSEITPEDIYAYYDQTGNLPRTSCPNPEEYVATFKKWTDQGYAVVFIGISSCFSSAYSYSVLAAGELEEVYSVDSRNLSTGIGLLVLEAAEMAQSGAWEAKEIAEKISAMAEKVRASFILDNLLYLWKGGRCSGVSALGANLLKLKPCIEVVDGKMIVGKKYRGTLESCLLSYVRDRLTDKDNLNLKRIFITHSGMENEELIEEVKKQVLALQPFAEVLITHAGCTISSHCGKNTLGILYLEK